MGKRKRGEDNEPSTPLQQPRRMSSSKIFTKEAATLQIITGSYERVLHGFTATVADSPIKEASSQDLVQFADTFLFNAHASAIRSLAVSPIVRGDRAQAPRVILASGGTDERINLYNLSISAPFTGSAHSQIPTLAGKTIVESSKNRELGALLHHSSSITALHFPSRSKLLSAAEDNTITVSRTKDWSLLSTIKVPQPKIQGRPSGDTAPVGTAPAGVNDFAVHPSMKLMVSVGKGEKCMRLWNLVTGKKAGVLNFGKEILREVGEGRWGGGDGRKVLWNRKGDQYAVAFERGVVVFGMDSKPKCRLLPYPTTKLHQICYLGNHVAKSSDKNLIAVSTEDGRVIFFSTDDVQLTKAPIANALIVGQIDARLGTVSGRIKDFEIIETPKRDSGSDEFFVVAGNSDGQVGIWRCSMNDLKDEVSTGETREEKDREVRQRQIGRFLGVYETGKRITCLRAFLMSEPEEDEEDDSFGGLDSRQESSEVDSDGST